MIVKKKETSFQQLKLDPPSKKKEKDPKVGRVWVAVSLLITVGLSGLFWLAKTVTTNGFEKIRIKKIAVSFPAVNFSSEQKSSFGFSQNSAGEIAKLIETNLTDKDGDWSVKVTDLESGFSVQSQSENKVVADSLIKLPVVALAYKQVEEGKLSLEDSFEVLKGDIQSETAGSLQYQSGEEISLSRLLFLSLNQSDNTAFTVLRRVLGDSAIQEDINRIGMSSTSLADNTTSANDIDLFFQKLYKGEIIKKYKDDYIIELIEVLPGARISASVPEGVKVAHKVGSDTEAVFDAGIVFVPEKPFVLTILSRGADRQSADQTISQLTEKIYWFIVSD